MHTHPCFVVLGGSGGIGSAVCARLRKSGADVLAGGRDPVRLGQLADRLGLKTFVLDATDFEQVNACLTEARSLFGRLDGITNCVGSLLLKPAHLTTEPEWHSTIAANLTTAFATVHAGARALSETGGSIVLVSSVAARVGLVNHEAIAAAKAGVIGLTRSAAASYAEKNVRVNCVAPGLVRTPMTARLTSNPASLKASVSMHPLGRIGEPEEVAASICWLLDPEQSWITGQVFGHDGGLSTVRPRVVQ